MDNELDRLRDEDTSGQYDPLTGWNPGPWPSAGDDDRDEDWQRRVERELQEEFPSFDVAWGGESITDDKGTRRAWSAQHECGWTTIQPGPIYLRNFLRAHERSHTMEKSA